VRTIGILGGMSAASTLLYYRMLCDLTRERLGGLASPDLLIRSVDFAPIAALQAAGDWDEAGARLNRAALRLEQGGADLVILATNTMHKVADQITDGLGIPFFHIADTTAKAVQERGLTSVGLIATAFTMDQPFYLDRLRTHGLEPIVPQPDERAEVHRIIYEELCRNEVRSESRARFEAVAQALEKQGAQGIILGCTEVGMLLGADNVASPVFDTARIHCEAALEAALK
jgi:aspartate racemase